MGERCFCWEYIKQKLDALDIYIRGICIILIMRDEVSKYICSAGSPVGICGKCISVCRGGGGEGRSDFGDRRRCEGLG